MINHLEDAYHAQVGLHLIQQFLNANAQIIFHTIQEEDVYHATHQVIGTPSLNNVSHVPQIHIITTQ